MDQMAKTIDPATVLQLLELLLRAVGQRVLAFVTLAMTFGLFSWAMWLQRPLAFGIAGAFTLGVLWPVLYVGWKGGNHE
jgi:hypothetical protein